MFCSRVGDHNHAADAASVEAAKVVREARQRAMTLQDSGDQIVDYLRGLAHNFNF